MMFKYRKLECSTFSVLIQIEKPSKKLFQPKIKKKIVICRKSHI